MLKKITDFTAQVSTRVFKAVWDYNEEKHRPPPPQNPEKLHLASKQDLETGLRKEKAKGS